MYDDHDDGVVKCTKQKVEYTAVLTVHLCYLQVDIKYN